MDVDQAVAKLKQHRVWAEAAVRFCGQNSRQGSRYVLRDPKSV